MAALAAAVAACGGGGDAGEAPGDAPTATAPPPAAPRGAEVPWQRAEPVRRGRALRVHLQTNPCHLPIRAARVVERADAVEVTLIGPVIEPDAVCIQIAVTRCATVELERPLGDRRVLDGARAGRRPPRGGGEPPTAEECPAVPVFPR